MAFKKGESGNIAGRKKGTKNKATILLEGRREEAYALVDKVLAFVNDEIESGNRERQVKAISNLSPILPFVLPKLSSVDATITGDMSINSVKFEDAKSNKN